MLDAAKDLIRSNVALYCVAAMAFDIFEGVAVRVGFNHLKTGPLEHGAFVGIEETVAHVEEIFKVYAAHSDRDHFTGSVCEIGVGGDVGALLMMLGAGAQKSAHAVDRFSGLRPEAEQRQLYQRLIEKHGLASQFDGQPSISTMRNLHYHCGMSADDYFAASTTKYDGIFSSSVMEHVNRPLVTLDRMMSTLAPQGVMVHAIDLADHKMLGDRHPLEFLTIPSLVYRRMTKNGIRPNRVMLHQYKRWALGCGANTRILIRRLVGDLRLSHAVRWEDVPEPARERAVRMVQDMRPRFAREFDDTADEDLAVAEVILSVNSGTC